MLFLASEHMSKSKFPLIHQVIPLFDSLINKFEDFISNENLFAGVQAAAIHGQAAICKYYSKTDDLIMYRMVMSNVIVVMHPAYKMEYFQEKEWEPEWIDKCYDIVWSVWKQHYKLAAAAVAPKEKQVYTSLCNYTLILILGIEKGDFFQ
ncbi:hypothetical protein ARMSODRAFT_898268 [Armillaria solidipes]|uniref:Uncharacterized protein n=1 Tax=Armillaria solidipes TaxID=1076256 RepID=A0A2H3AN99_9AGAR|nr:hypothetical protein ARMSODRAFT_898268 [Armillaria solidipes]